MEIIRRNTDYGLRMMITLANHSGNGQLVSASCLVRQCDIPYDVGRKVLQNLREAGMVKTVRGSKGGFILNRRPSRITLLSIINVLQGSIYLNKCLVSGEKCQLEPDCEVNAALAHLQQFLTRYLGGITLEKMLRSTSRKRLRAKGRFSKKENREM